jgi:hypothetical protein
LALQGSIAAAASIPQGKDPSLGGFFALTRANFLTRWHLAYQITIVVDARQADRRAGSTVLHTLSLAALTTVRGSVAAVTADASLDGLRLNGRLFQSPVQPTEYAAVLESPPRVVEPSPPAPYGHRNNQIHLFDELGLYLIEHHATRLVDAVVFVLWLEESAFKPVCEYLGELTIGGVRFFPGMTPPINRTAQSFSRGRFSAFGMLTGTESGLV